MSKQYVLNTYENVTLYKSCLIYSESDQKPVELNGKAPDLNSMGLRGHSLVYWIEDCTGP